ncbi:MAG: aminoacyl-tRNA hydrolase [Candidatus Aenigmarchaeota archaeon ex4484_56]|nr:MAG: aminoacyl-tRNA hydrolase [Candidatus Aenigmarchaeota archaeon ex4484_56]
MKQAIIVRKDLKLGKGKIASQVAHASLSSYNRTDKKLRKIWEKTGSKKIVLKVDNEKELIKLHKKAVNMGISNYIVIDAGLTQVPKATITCLAIGPDEEEKIDNIIKDLKLL